MNTTPRCVRTACSLLAVAVSLALQGCSRPTNPEEKAGKNGAGKPEVRANPKVDDLEVRADGLHYLKGTSAPYSGMVEAHAGGKKQGEASYVAGRREGVATVWHPNGRVAAQIQYKAGMMDGVAREYSQEGTLVVRRFYAGGKLYEDLKDELAREVEQQFQERQRLDSTLWHQEELAQKHEETIIDFWDALRASSDPLAIFESLNFESIQLGRPGERQKRDDGVTLTEHAPGGERLTNAQWRQWLAGERKAGLRVVETEWHQETFARETPGGPYRSSFRFNIHATRGETRYMVNGSVKIDWGAQPDLRGLYPITGLDATKIRVQERSGRVAFSEHRVFDTGKDVPDIAPRWKAGGKGKVVPKAVPVLVYDLDRDGRSEIVIANANLLFWNKGGGRFEKDSLCRQPPAREVGSAVLADFDGDGRADLFVAQNFGPPLLYVADAAGRFGEARQVEVPGLSPMISFATTAGDIDGDGDLDLWVSQYKPPYGEGQMPTPYYDANDGWPSFLLLNDGRGRFTEGTKAAGLEPKSTRRTYSASFADLDDDGDLDLLTVNDFSGIDIYLNDGRGKFTDDTARLGDTRHAFGMSHVIADFNRDGLWDVYMTGMGSTTARRLESFKLGRSEFPEHQAKRLKLGYGNRMYYGAAGGLSEQPLKDQVARTGWAWGSAAVDFDNDGDEDLYIANGHISRKSCRDYCTTYWRHDIYTGTSQTNRVISSMFTETLKPLDTISWNGFEHNVLFMNELSATGQQYLNVGWVMGVAFEFDARSVLSEDWDGDGRQDLLVGRFGWSEQEGEQFNYLHALRNEWEGPNRWIGVRLHENGPGYSPIGAQVSVLVGGKRLRAAVVTGDSWRCQQSGQKHFGLGAASEVEAIEVRWPNGKVTRLDRPAINQYHTLKPAAPSPKP